MPSASTIAEILIERGTGAEGDRPVITYLRPGEAALVATGADLLTRARHVAGGLIARGLTPGERVMLMLPSPSDFVDAFFGAIWAGAIPVPVPPPMFVARQDDYLGQIAAVVRNARPGRVITSREIGQLAADSSRACISGLPVLSPEDWVSSEQLVAQQCGDAAQLAFLQYSSGSTGSPKGVALSHHNVLSNVIAIGRAIGLGRDDVGVSWLPLYHDMGLVGGLLSGLYWGASLVLLSPLEFAKRPVRWLRAVSDHRGTVSPAPNFAFRRCLCIPDDEAQGLDLSSWRVAFNGAEPVDEQTLRSFAERFAPFGFKRRSLYPVYGLAEHTLAVSVPHLGDEPRFDRVDRTTLAQGCMAASVPAGHQDAVTVVSVGRPLDGVSVEIRAGDEPLPEGQVGEIAVRSPSVMMGYFDDAVATAAVLAGGWLSTGDLGYMKSGNLYITGRKKDLVIRAGRKYYPQDIESAAGEVTGTRAGRIASFSVDVGGAEHVVVLLETRVRDEDAREKMKRNVAAAVAARLGFRPEHIVLCEPFTLPVTSSGKVRRAVARARFIAELSSPRSG